MKKLQVAQTSLILAMVAASAALPAILFSRRVATFPSAKMPEFKAPAPRVFLQPAPQSEPALLLPILPNIAPDLTPKLVLTIAFNDKFVRQYNILKNNKTGATEYKEFLRDTQSYKNLTRDEFIAETAADLKHVTPTARAHSLVVGAPQAMPSIPLGDSVLTKAFVMVTYYGLLEQKAITTEECDLLIDQTMKAIKANKPEKNKDITFRSSPLALPWMMALQGRSARG